MRSFLQKYTPSVARPWVFLTGCCGELSPVFQSSIHDLARLGVLEIPNSPSEANLLIVGGWINQALSQKLIQDHKQMPKDTKVMAIGTCAISASLFKELDKDVYKMDEILPVDIYVPGCPPREETLVKAIYELLNKKKELKYEDIKMGKVDEYF
ncbi:MAG: hypothetical protein AB8E15_06750 [Bdellovibrionales bacterium]